MNCSTFVIFYNNSYSSFHCFTAFFFRLLASLSTSSSSPFSSTASPLEAEERLPAVSTNFFLAVWRKHRPHFVLRKFLAFAKCETCTLLREKREKRVDAQVLEATKLEWAQHIRIVKGERRYYHSFIKSARTLATFDEWLSLIVDGTEQAAYAIPHFAQASKKTNEVTKVQVHLIGVIAHGRGAFAFTMYEDIGKKNDYEKSRMRKAEGGK